MPLWIAWTLLTLVSWGVWAILFRLIGSDISPAHSQAISTLGILPVFAALWLVKESPGTCNRRRGILLALGSGILSCLGNVACYEALNHAKAATVIPLTALYPVVTVLLAVPLLKERLNLLQWIGVGLSLAAIYLFNVPQGTDAEAGRVSSAMLLPLAAVLLWGITGLMQKAATNDVSARASAIWFLAAFFPVAGLILLQDPLMGDLAPRTWALAIAMGFTLALGNLTILLAFSSGGKASIIAPLAGLYFLVSIPIALVKFHERLDWREAAAIALALAAVVLLSLQSKSDHATPSTMETDASL
ncbi:MAG: DMT family transporter [Pirellulales bacterium]